MVVAPFKPDDVDPPPLAALLHEVERLKPLPAGVEEADMDILGQSVLIGVEHLAEHEAARAPAAEADERRAFDEVGVAQAHRPPSLPRAGGGPASGGKARGIGGPSAL